MSKTLFTAAVLVGFILPIGPAFSGGWTHAPGNGYFKLNMQAISGDTYFLPSGDRAHITSQSRYTTSLYGEFGLVDRLNIVGYVPFYQRISVDDPGINPESGTADWELGVRLGLVTTGATVVSIQAMAGLPLGDSEQEVGLFTGDGEFNQSIFLQVGHSLYPTPGYLKGEIGFNNRESGFSDELRYAVEAGRMVGKRVGVSVQVRGAQALGRSDEVLTVNDLQYISFGPEVYVNLTPAAGITAGLTKYIAAHNLLDAPAWDIGIFLKL